MANEGSTTLNDMKKDFEPPATDLHLLSASEVLPLLQDGSLSVEKYAKALLNYIETRDDMIHAWAFLDPDHVVTQAKLLDQIPSSERGPLHGLPVGVKDVLTTAGTCYILSSF